MSRRGFLLGASSAVIAAPVGFRPDVAFARTKDAATAQGTVEAQCFSETWESRYVVQFPVATPLPDAGARREDSNVTITWDRRLFDVRPVAALASHDGFESVASSDYRPGHMRVRVGGEATDLLLQAAVRDLYPLEALGRPIPSRLDYSWVTTRPDLSARQSKTKPWGAEIYAAWATGEGASYPTDVLIRSVGPNPIPSGTDVVMRAQASTPAPKANAAPKTAGGGGRHSIKGRLRDVIFTLSEAVEADRELRIDARPGARLLAQDMPRDVAEVFIRPPKRQLASMRDTGRLTVVPLTASGVLVAAGSRIEGA
ncbi:hypothetical protein [Microbacterium mangrovi]|uniref:hypothetical protein n=1 Tax=Microbacterium mangrovi TaxID=1348253 RepID=UPI0012E0A614|nr:hypothetical protein [Microbacterium mangrovi]